MPFFLRALLSLLTDGADLMSLHNVVQLALERAQSGGAAFDVTFPAGVSKASFDDAVRATWELFPTGRELAYRGLSVPFARSEDACSDAGRDDNQTSCFAAAWGSYENQLLLDGALPSTVLGLANRVRDRDEVFARFAPLREEGQRGVVFWHASGALLAVGYLRLLFGDHGPYIELHDGNVHWDVFRGPHVLKGPHRHYHEHRLTPTAAQPLLGEDGAKLYNQFRGVSAEPSPPPGLRSQNNMRPDGYAGYLGGRLYLSVDDVSRVEMISDVPLHESLPPWVKWHVRRRMQQIASTRTAVVDRLSQCGAWGVVLDFVAVAAQQRLRLVSRALRDAGDNHLQRIPNIPHAQAPPASLSGIAKLVGACFDEATRRGTSAAARRCMLGLRSLRVAALQGGATNSTGLASDAYASCAFATLLSTAPTVMPNLEELHVAVPFELWDHRGFSNPPLFPSSLCTLAIADNRCRPCAVVPSSSFLHFPSVNAVALPGLCDLTIDVHVDASVLQSALHGLSPSLRRLAVPLLSVVLSSRWPFHASLEALTVSSFAVTTPDLFPRGSLAEFTAAALPSLLLPVAASRLTDVGAEESAATQSELLIFGAGLRSLRVLSPLSGDVCARLAAWFPPAAPAPESSSAPLPLLGELTRLELRFGKSGNNALQRNTFAPLARAKRLQSLTLITNTTTPTTSDQHAASATPERDCACCFDFIEELPELKELTLEGFVVAGTLPFASPSSLCVLQLRNVEAVPSLGCVSGVAVGTLARFEMTDCSSGAFRHSVMARVASSTHLQHIVLGENPTDAAAAAAADTDPDLPFVPLQVVERSTGEAPLLTFSAASSFPAAGSSGGGGNIARLAFAFLRSFSTSPTMGRHLTHLRLGFWSSSTPNVGEKIGADEVRVWLEKCEWQFLRALPRLISLEVQCRELSASAVGALCDALPPLSERLERLALDVCWPSNRCYVFGPCEFSSLRELVLSPAATDATVLCVADRAPRLESLCLRGNVAVRSIAPLRRLASLRFLDISGTRCVTTDADGFSAVIVL